MASNQTVKQQSFCSIAFGHRTWLERKCICIAWRPEPSLLKCTISFHALPHQPAMRAFFYFFLGYLCLRLLNRCLPILRLIVGPKFLILSTLADLMSAHCLSTVGISVLKTPVLEVCLTHKRSKFFFLGLLACNIEIFDYATQSSYPR